MWFIDLIKHINGKWAYIIILPAAVDLDSLNKLFPQNIFIEINLNVHSSFPHKPTLRHFEMHISYFNKKVSNSWFS